MESSFYNHASKVTLCSCGACKSFRHKHKPFIGLVTFMPGSTAWLFSFGDIFILSGIVIIPCVEKKSYLQSLDLGRYSKPDIHIF